MRTRQRTFGYGMGTVSTAVATIEARAAVRCSSCGDAFTLAATNARRYRRAGREPVCQECRQKPRPVDEAQRQRLRAWWVGRLGEDEARELARVIWPQDMAALEEKAA